MVTQDEDNFSLQNIDLYRDMAKKDSILDIDAFRGSTELHVVNFDMIIFNYYRSIREAIRSSDIHVINNIVKALEMTTFQYLTQEEKSMISSIDTKHHNKMGRLKDISSEVLSRDMYNINTFSYVFEKLEQINNGMFKNKVFYSSDVFLALITNHYSMMAFSAMSPIKYFSDVLFLKCLTYPFMNQQERLKVNDSLETGINLFEFYYKRGLSNKAYAILMRNVYGALYILLKVLDARGILFEKQINLDLSLAKLTQDERAFSVAEKQATLFLRDIKARTQTQNRNWMSVISGQTGSGKSYTGLWLCKTLDPTFDVDRVVFSFKEFMEVINKLIEENKKEKVTGKSILWDETGIDLDSRKFYSTVNILTNQVLQTFRSDCFNVIFTVPHPSFVDVRSRILFHHILETKTILRNEDKVMTAWYESHHSPAKNDDRLWHPRIMFDGKRYLVKNILIPKPDKDLIKAYEDKKGTFNKSLKDKISDKINEVKTVEKKSVEDLRTIATQIIEKELNSFSTMRSGKYVFNAEMLAIRFALMNTDAKKLKIILEDLLNN